MSSSSSAPSPSSSSSSSFPQSTFLYSGYHSPYSSPPQPLPSFYSLESWPADPMHVMAWWLSVAEQRYHGLQPSCSPTCFAAVAWPNSMQLATVSADGQPHVRTVLLKGLDGRGLLFFTNYEGAKGRQLLRDNAKAAVVFHWKQLERQVRVEGSVSAVSAAESDAYFHSRPLGSQLSASVSPQSRSIGSRQQLEQHYRRQVNAVAQAADDGAAQPLHIPPCPSRPSPDDSIDQDASQALHAEALKRLAALESHGASSGSNSARESLVSRPPNWGGLLLSPTRFEFWEDGVYRLHSRIQYDKTSKKRERSAAEEQQPAAAGSLQHEVTADWEWDKGFLAP